MAAPRMPAFDPFDVVESNATAYPEPLAEPNRHRWNRRLGDAVGLTRFGVTLTRIEPGGQSSYRHAHSAQDEFVWVLEGDVTMETDDGAQILRPGTCAGFPAGTGATHRFVNHGDRDALILVVGDRTPGDDVTYADLDIRGRSEDGRRYTFTRKDGSSF